MHVMDMEIHMKIAKKSVPNLVISKDVCNFLFQQENLLLDSMFEIPGSDIVSVHITAEAVRGEAAPIFVHGQPVPSEDDQEEEQVLAQAK